MTELRAKAIAELEKLPEEHVAEVIDFLEKFNEKRKKEEQEKAEAKAAEKRDAEEAFENLKKYFKRIPADFDLEKERLEWLEEKYGITN